MARIAIGGFQHETNTFAPSKADYAAFEEGGGWPGVQYGDALFPAVEGANIPAAGAIRALRARGHALVGTAWAAASPSAHVTGEAFERIAGELVSRLAAALPVDGVYLDLHGAMVVETFDDGEGELLRRVRQALGPRVPRDVDAICAGFPCQDLSQAGMTNGLKGKNSGLIKAVFRR